MIDTHAHIYAQEFSDDIADVISRAKKAGVKHILLPNIDSSSVDDLKALVESYPQFCYAMMGLHPCSVKDNYENELKSIKPELNQGHCIAVGEIGIDLYWEQSTRDMQIKAFLEQCRWALELDLPVVIHSRESIDLLISLISEHFPQSLRGVFHCFTGSEKQALEILDLGMYLGIGGVFTFKNSNLKSFIKRLPLDKLLLETDSPYLAPVPYRGKRNEPSYVIEVHQKLALELEMDPRDLDQILDSNALNLFGI
jgi:TatD DNase family protein